MRQRTFLFLGFGATAFALAACSSTSQLPVSANPYGTYKVGKPYEVDGKWYYPAEDWSYDKTGIASWYGREFEGKYTADGEIFNPNALTAAQKTLPLPSIVQVTNLENGRSIRVRVNDRGPFVRGRIIDLSRRAAQLLGFEEQGTAKVRVKLLVGPTLQVASLAGRKGPPPTVAAAQAKPVPVAKVTTQSLPTPAGIEVASAQPVQKLPAPPPAPPAQSVAVDPPQPDKVTYVPVKPSQIYIQAGAFASIARAVRLESLLDRYGNVTVSSVKAHGLLLYRVRVGPVATVHEADALLAKVSETSPQAQIVVN